MRVLSALLLLGCSLLGVSSQYATSTTSSTNAWVLNGIAGTNPPLSFTAGNTYTFDITATSPGANSIPHPFNFSSVEAAVTALDPTLYTVSSSGCGAPNNNGFLGQGCVVSLTIAGTAPNATIFYKCTLHPAMTGSITIAANTTVTPTTATPTTSAPTSGPISGATLRGNSFHITGAAFTNGVPTSYIFTDGGNQYLNPTLSVAAANVTFSIEFNNTRHPFGFSTNGSDAAVAPTAAYFPGQVDGFTINSAQACDLGVASGVRLVVANATTPATTPCVITVPLEAQDAGSAIYYRCAYHPKMLGQINVTATNSTSSSSSSTSSSTNSTSSSSSSTSTSTNSTSSSSSSSGSSSSSSSSTGANKPGTASTVTGAGLALVVALMAAIIA